MFCLPMMVHAETTVTKTSSVDHSRWIDGTNLLRMESDSGYGIATMDGTFLTESIYTSSFDYTKGYICSSEATDELNNKGAFALDGTIVVPFEYADIETLNNHWFLGIVLESSTATQYDYTSWLGKDDYYLIKTVDVYYLEDGKGTKVASLTRDQYIDSSAFGSYINIQDRTTNIITTYDSQFTQIETGLGHIYDTPIETRDLLTFRFNGQYGLVDADGNEVMPASFKYIYDFYRGYAEVSTGEKNGLIDEEGNLILPTEYDQIKKVYTLPSDPIQSSGYNANGYFAVVVDGKLGFVDENGAMTCEPKYAADVVELNGASAMLTDLEGKTHLIAADGMETLIEGYERVSVLYYGSGMYYKVADSNYKYGMIDWHGNEIFPCEYDNISLSGDGNYVLAAVDYADDIYQIVYTPDTLATPAEIEETEDTDVSESSANSAIISLLDSASSLLANDSDSNRKAASSLLENAVSLLGADQETVSALLNSAVILLGTEGSDLNGILTLISNAKDMLA